MPSGQSQTKWFPALKNMIKEQWVFSLNVDAHFELLERLNEKLEYLRKKYDVKPAMFWCRNCQKRHPSILMGISITGMYYALERFELCTHEEHLALKRNWKKYSKEKAIDIYGKSKEIA